MLCEPEKNLFKRQSERPRELINRELLKRQPLKRQPDRSPRELLKRQLLERQPDRLPELLNMQPNRRSRERIKELKRQPERPRRLGKRDLVQSELSNRELLKRPLEWPREPLKRPKEPLKRLR